MNLNFPTVPLAELAAKGIIPQAGGTKPVVLVVDDEVVIADTLTAILKQNGLAAMAAYDGTTALQIVRSIPPHLLLTDVAMPGINGIDLAIATQRAVPDCKVLLFSGHAATADLLARARSEGHNFTILQKPLHPAELLVRVSEALKVQSPKENGSKHTLRA
jgi:DNA-binding NtrC family response regulator